MESWYLMWLRTVQEKHTPRCTWVCTPTRMHTHTRTDIHVHVFADRLTKKTAKHVLLPSLIPPVINLNEMARVPKDYHSPGLAILLIQKTSYSWLPEAVQSGNDRAAGMLQRSFGCAVISAASATDLKKGQCCYSGHVCHNFLLKALESSCLEADIFFPPPLH